MGEIYKLSEIAPNTIIGGIYKINFKNNKINYIKDSNLVNGNINNIKDSNIVHGDGNTVDSYK